MIFQVNLVELAPMTNIAPVRLE